MIIYYQMLESILFDLFFDTKKVYIAQPKTIQIHIENEIALLT